MRTRSSSNLIVESSTTPKRRNRRRSKQRVEPFSLEETFVVTMADQRTMAELLQAPTEGYGDAIVIPAILAENFELKHGLLNLVTSKQFYGFEKEYPHAHIRWFNKITSTIKYKDVPNSSIKLMLFPFSIEGAARIWLEKEPPHSILTWEDLVSKFINQFFPPSKTTNLRNEITNFQQKFEETFSEAWDRFKDLLRACPHHGFTELHQLDTFYNALNPTDQDSLNAAAGVSTNAPSSSTPHFPEIAALADAVKAMLLQKSSPPASVKAVEEICVTCGGPHPYHQCLATDGNVFPEYRDNIQGYVSAAAVNYNQGNTGYRPQSVANQIRPPGFAQPNVQNNQTRYNQGYNQNRGNNQGNPNYQAPIQQTQVAPSNELLNYKKINDANMKAMQNQINNVKNELRNEMQTSMSNQTNELKNMMASFFQMNTASSSGSGSLPSNIVANPRGDLKAITTRSGISYNGPPILHPLSLLPKVVEREPEVTKDTLVECLAWVDLGASINLMPLSIWKKLSLPELTPTQMILELADRSTTSPSGIAEDVFVKVGKFHFPADFVVVDYVVDPRVPLILERPFLRMARALIDVYGEELTLRVDDEAITFKVGQTSRYSYNNAVSTSANPTPSLDPILSTSSLSLTPFEEGDFILEEIEACHTNDSVPPGIDDDDFDPEGDILLLEKLLNDDPSSPLPLKELHVEELKIVKSFIDDPPELELKDLPSHLEYAFLEGTDKLPVIIAKNLKEDEKVRLLKILIDLQDQEKTTFTCLYGTFAYRRMPFGLCNVSGTFQRCMMAIFHDMIEETMEVFMDNFSVFEDSFSSCLSHLDKMLKRCEDTNLVLNWEKYHFMVKVGTVLGNKISKSRIEVDKAKVDVIAKLPHPNSVKSIQSFLGHAGFYRRFIQDFSKIARPMTHLFEKDTPFIFLKECIEAFNILKKKLTEAPILVAP
ncbi:reverse transcriptase domain-containing protein, partial [Tanacetum coccineum]